MALIFSRSVFIHIPKTGGTSVRAALKRAGYMGFESGNLYFQFNKRYHSRPTDDVAGFQFGGRFLFTFVRDPVDWYRSYWAHRQRHAWTLKQYDEEKAAWDIRKTFGEWVIDICALHPGFLSRIYSEYTAGVDFVGRTENLLEDLREALRLSGEDRLPEWVPEHNTAGNLPECDDATRELIEESESKCLAFCAV